MRLSTADCICISGFWGLCPRCPPGLCPWSPLGDFRPPNPLCPPYLQILATPLADSTRFTVFTYLLVERGNDVIDLLPPYSSKTSRATVAYSRQSTFNPNPNPRLSTACKLYTYKNLIERSVGSKDRVKTNGRTDWSVMMIRVVSIT